MNSTELKSYEIREKAEELVRDDLLTPGMLTEALGNCDGYYLELAIVQLILCNSDDLSELREKVFNEYLAYSKSIYQTAVDAIEDQYATDDAERGIRRPSAMSEAGHRESDFGVAA